MRRMSVTIIAAVVLMCSLAAEQTQKVLASWSTPEALTAWKEVGRPAGTVPRDASGLVLTIDPVDAPNVIRSPRMKIPAVAFGKLRLTYLASVITPTPEFLIGWGDNVHHSDAMIGCGIVVPITIGQLATVEVDLATSPCWKLDATIEEIDINLDGRSERTTGTVYIKAIDLRRR